MTTRLQMLIGLVMLLLGGMIYLLFRPTTLLLFHTLDMVGLMPLVTDWRTLAAACQPSEFVVYSLPGGLWAAAYILLVVSLLGRVRRWQRMMVASIIPGWHLFRTDAASRTAPRSLRHRRPCLLCGAPYNIKYVYNH